MDKIVNRPVEGLFSILVANYNNGHYVAEAIESVLKQTYNNWEIVIVDDASTDDSISVVRPFLDDERIKLFRNAINQGCGYTKRRCIELAKADICGFLDPDDVLACDALVLMIEAHRQHPDHSVINSTHYQCDESLKIQQISPYPRKIPEGKTYLSLNDGSIHHFASFKKSYYRLTKGLNPQYKKAIDQPLYLLLDSVGKAGYIDKPLYYYRIHKGGSQISRILSRP